MKMHTPFHRLTAGMILLAYAGGLTVPAMAAQPPAEVRSIVTADWTPPAPVKSKRARLNRPKKITPPSFKAASLEDPSLDEMNGARALKVPLRTLRGKTVSKKDKQDLARQMKRFADDRSPSRAHRLKHLTDFLDQHPDSGITASVHLDVALSAAASGDFVLASQSYLAAWQMLRGETAQKDLVKQAETALGNLALVYARTGQKQALTSLLEEVQTRTPHTDSIEMLEEAREALRRWQTDPLASLECGITAYNFLAEQSGQPQLSKHGQAWGESEEQAAAEVAANLELIEKGLAASDLLDRILNAGAEYKLIKRISGTFVPAPSVVHLKFGEATGHYSALIAAGTGDSTVLRDPHLQIDGPVENSVLNKMASGFFIVKSGFELPEGFEDASNDDAFTVRGRVSCPSGKDKQGDDDTPCPEGCGMPTYAFSSFHAGLVFKDTPLTYQPVYGPRIDFTVVYREVSSDYDDVTADTSNFGRRWSHGLLSYVTAENGDTLPADTTMKWKRSDGTFYRYKWDGTEFTTSYLSRPVLTKLPGNQGYKLTFKDDSSMEFTQANGSVITRFYLTKLTDAQGHSLTLGYDSLVRLATITDATGKVSTFEYTGSSLSIAKIVDPYSREALFTYDGSGNLQTVTDAIGLTSSFTYTGRQVSSMTTPYGTHTFRDEFMRFRDPVAGEVWGEAYGNARVAKDPQGDEERAVPVYHDGRLNASASEPRPPTSITAGTATAFFTTVLNEDHFNVTLKWTKKYWREYLKADEAAKKLTPPVSVDPFNFAEMTLWLNSSGGYSVSVPHAHKLPGLAMEWYNYPGQTSTTAFRSGTDDRPVRAARYTENSTIPVPPAVQGFVWVMKQQTYNALGLPLVTKDEIGRTYLRVYHTNNQDVRLHRLNTSTGPILRVYEDYVRHLPGTIIEASGLTHTITRNVADQVTLTSSAKGSEIPAQTRYTYDQNGQGTPDGQPGYLMKVERTLEGSWNTLEQFTYDDHGRIATHTDATGYVRSFDYDDFDRVTLITHPDASTEQTVYHLLDVSATKDRANRWSRTFYNQIRQPIFQLAWDGKGSRYDWCRCGKLYKFTDPAGNVTEWKLDTLGRVTEEIRADATATPGSGTRTTYTYQARSGRLSTIKRPNEQSAGVPTVTYYYHVDGGVKEEDWLEMNGETNADVTYTYETTGLGRLSGVVDSIGSHSFTYVAIPTSLPGSTSLDGAGQIATYDSPLANADVQYFYDWHNYPIGGGVGNYYAQWGIFDDLGRVQATMENGDMFYYTYGTPANRPDVVSPATSSNGEDIVQKFTYYPNNASGGKGGRLQSSVSGVKDSTTIPLVQPIPTVFSEYTFDYDPAGRITSVEKNYPSEPDLLETYGYNLSDELTSHVKKNVTAGTVVTQSGWSYDALGNWLSTSTPSTMTTRTHDSTLNRLTGVGGVGKTAVEGKVNEYSTVRVKANTDPVVTAPLTPDPAGGYRFRVPVEVKAGSNTINVKADDGVDPETDQNWTFTAAAAVAGDPWKYDANGNLTDDNVRLFTWDAKDRLRKVTIKATGQKYEWDYDWQGRRLREFRYTGTTRTNPPAKLYHWLDNQLVAELNGTTTGVVTGTPARLFTAHTMTDVVAGKHYIVSRDHLGNVRELIGPPGSTYERAVITRYEYSSYLEASVSYRHPLAPAADTLMPINGYYHHAGTGLELAKYRAYDPKLGRFISEDPLGLAGGLNLYGYVGNNPVNAVDPDGRLPILIPILIGALFGGATVAWAPGPDDDTSQPPNMGATPFDFIGPGGTARGCITRGAISNSIKQIPRITPFLAVIHGGKVIAHTTDFSMSHPGLIARKLGGVLPEGSQVVTAGTNSAGKFVGNFSQSIHGHMNPLPPELLKILKDFACP